MFCSKHMLILSAAYQLDEDRRRGKLWLERYRDHGFSRYAQLQPTEQ